MNHALALRSGGTVDLSELEIEGISRGKFKLIRRSIELMCNNDISFIIRHDS